MGSTSGFGCDLRVCLMSNASEERPGTLKSLDMEKNERYNYKYMHCKRQKC